MNMVQGVLPLVLDMPDVKHLAWFSASLKGGDHHDQAQYLWKGESLTELGKEYLNQCSKF